MTNTNEPPAFGPQRNAALAELLGAKRYALTHVGPHLYRLLTPFQAEVTADYPGYYCEADFDALPMPSSLMYTTDYCGNDADCFRLLAETSYFVSSRLSAKVKFVLESDDFLVGSAASSLSDKREALRDAITAAAWKARTSQKESQTKP